MVKLRVEKLILWKYSWFKKGGDISDPESMGIIPRVMNRLFEMIDQASENIEFSIKVSFLEIYNERIQDLLNPLNSNLKIKENKLNGVFVDECTEVYVSSPQEMRDAMLLGSQNRTIASTRMNDRSSRSHSIFVMTISQKDLGSGSTKTSRIYFVDLAGSEKIAKTEVKGKQLEEAKNINKSLTALGMVINTLAEGKKGAHVPYRDSKLTRLLQDSLGGNAMATLLIACSMCSYNDKETLSTLRFGQRAKCIKNKPKENVELSARELQALLEASELKIKDLEELVSLYQAECSKQGVIVDVSQHKNYSENLQDNFEKPDLRQKTNESTSDNLLNQEVDLLGISIPESNDQRGWTDESSSLLLGLSFPDEKKMATETKSSKELNELREKVSKQAQEIIDLNEMIEIIQAEMEDLTIENVDLKEKNEKLVKGGVKLISRYHKELGHANLAFEHIAIKIQKKWVQYSQLVSELEQLRDSINLISEKLEVNPKLSRLLLPLDCLQEVGTKRLDSTEHGKEVSLHEFVTSIAQEILNTIEKNPLKLNISEFNFSIDQELMNLTTSISKFKNSVLEEIHDTLLDDKSPSYKDKTPLELHKISEIETGLPKVDLIEIPVQLKGLFDECQTVNDNLRTKVKTLQDLNTEIRVKLKSDFDLQMIENIQKHNEEINLKGQELEELQSAYAEIQSELMKVTTQNYDLISELDNLRRGINQEISTPRGDYGRGKVSDFGSSNDQIQDKDSNSLIKKVARYREERDRAEQNSRELRARLLIAEEHLQIETEKNLVLKRTIKELEFELDELTRNQKGNRTIADAHLSQQVKTLRGGNKQKRELLPHEMNVFTCEDHYSERSEDSEDLYDDMAFQNSIGNHKETPKK